MLSIFGHVNIFTLVYLRILTRFFMILRDKHIMYSQGIHYYVEFIKKSRFIILYFHCKFFVCYWLSFVIGCRLFTISFRVNIMIVSFNESLLEFLHILDMFLFNFCVDFLCFHLYLFYLFSPL